ncbi:MAG: hypothetical protein JXA11_08705 [Phycisphaerae bacterium]|nr:hypothetical protein [Phycisphaerae bacterium]
MKRRYRFSRCSFLLLGTLSVFSVPTSADDPAGFTSISAKVPPAVKLVNADFQSGGKGWRLSEGFSIDRNGGRNGTAGLRYQRTDPKQYVLGIQTVFLQPGARYRFSAWIRSKDLKGRGKNPAIRVEFWNHGQYLNGSGAGLSEEKWNSDDWTLVRGETAIPENATKCTVVLYLGKGTTGSVWFDDVRVEPAAPRVDMHVVAPAFETITPRDGRIRVNIYTEGFPKNLLSDRQLRVAAHVRGKVVKTVFTPVQDHTADVNLSGLPIGKATLQMTLLNPKRKVILGETTSPLTVVPSDRPIPADACRIDRNGRATVNGEPFLPVGLYVDDLNPNNLERFAAGPFNCIMPQNSRYMNLHPKTQPVSMDTVREALDACHAKNLKVIFAVNMLYEDIFAKRKVAWFGTEDETEVVTKIVTTFRDHPALLAWHINDEIPIAYMDQLNARRRRINRLDPYHPTWAVLYQYGDLPLYGSACDVIGVDPYPIYNRDSRTMAKVEVAMDAVERTGLPAWVVPQLFNWGTALAKGDTKRFHEEFVDPSEEQMRAMSLLPALRGAKGFIFYSYHSLVRATKPGWFNPPAQTPDDLERRWQDICRVAAMLRNLEPFLLSDVEAPAVKIDVKQGNVKAREFRDKKGNVRVLITGIGPGQAEAVITTTAPMNLRSLYGRCKSLGDGKYRFTGTDICSDILTGDK